MRVEKLIVRLVGWLRIYAELTKSRLVTLVVLTAGVGYVMAAGAAWSLARLAWTLAGTALAAGGAMALNERQEVSRDARMERTRHRPLPAGQLSPAHALAFGLVTASSGIVTLALATETLTAALALVVVLTYTLVYTPLKPRTTLCTLAGALCGAIPPMLGWSAAGSGIGLGAWVLGAVLVLWQIPHFLSLAWLYRNDYASAGFRMLPVVDRGGRATAGVAILYTVALLPVSLTAALAGVAGAAYALGALALGIAFLAHGLALARSRSDVSARRLFVASLLYLPLLLGLMVADRRPVPGAWLELAARRQIAAPAQPAAVVASGGAARLAGE